MVKHVITILDKTKKNISSIQNVICESFIFFLFSYVKNTIICFNNDFFKVKSFKLNKKQFINIYIFLNTFLLWTLKKNSVLIKVNLLKKAKIIQWIRVNGFTLWLF